MVLIYAKFSVYFVICMFITLHLIYLYSDLFHCKRDSLCTRNSSYFALYILRVLEFGPYYNRLPLRTFEQGIGRESLLIATFTLSPIKQFWRLFYAASLIRAFVKTLSCNVSPDDMPPRDGT